MDVPSPQPEPLGIVSIVMGVLAYLLSCCGGFLVGGFALCLTGPLALGALVLGGLSMSKANAEPEMWSGPGLGIAGIVLGGSYILLALAGVGLTIAGVGSLAILSQF